MIRYDDIIQQTAEWYEIKYGKVGGSIAKSLFVKSYTLMYSLLACRCEDFELGEDGYESTDMQRGNELEPFAVRDLEAYIGVKFESTGWVEHDTIKLIGISPDGLNKESTISCEVKCPAAKTHIDIIKNNIIPLEYVHQCIHAFTVIDTLKELYFCSYRPENKYKPLFVKKITRESFVNIGTKAKPVMKTVQMCVELSEIAAMTLESLLVKELESLDF